MRTRWRPPAGTTLGICPACQRWVPLTPKCYVKEHHVIVRDGQPVEMYTRGAVVTTGEKVVRCVGIGRDPLKHECSPPDLSGGVPGTWRCKCGLTWATTLVEKQWRWAIYQTPTRTG